MKRIMLLLATIVFVVPFLYASGNDKEYKKLIQELGIDTIAMKATSVDEFWDVVWKRNERLCKFYKAFDKKKSSAVKANDDILSGQSTFMVEMIEANNALSNATKDSLIVFDEIGRGTSTYDGMALAQAILEYIDTKIMAKTLFSTHYHELTNLENNMEHIKNKHVVVNENNGEISFLYKVKDGKADKSYGIHVASLAKLPQAVIDRANILLVNLTNNKKVNNDQSQIIMLETVPSDLKQIKDLVSLADINNMTPLEALQFVVKLKEIIKEK